MVLIAGAIVSYAINPIWKRFTETPTQLSINGNSDWSFPIYHLIYGSQLIYCYYGFVAMSAYDLFFIQCIMQLSYRFTTMSDLLSLLQETGERNARKDKEVLVDIYKMHLDVLE